MNLSRLVEILVQVVVRTLDSNQLYTAAPAAAGNPYLNSGMHTLRAIRAWLVIRIVRHLTKRYVCCFDSFDGDQANLLVGSSRWHPGALPPSRAQQSARDAERIGRLGSRASARGSRSRLRALVF